MQSVSPNARPNLRSADLGAAAQAFYESFDKPLEFSPGINVTSRIPMGILPPVVRDLLGVAANDQITIEGSAVFDLQVFLGGPSQGASVSLSRLNLLADLPAARPEHLPTLPASMSSPVGMQRSIVISYQAPDLVFQVIDTIDVRIDGQQRQVMLVSELDTTGGNGTLSFHGRFLGSWANPWGVPDLVLNDAGFEMQTDGATSELSVHANVRIGGKTVDAEMSVKTGAGGTDTRVVVSIDRLSTNDLVDLVTRQLDVDFRASDIPVALTMTDVTVALQFGSQSSASILATTTFQDFESDLLLSVKSAGTRSGGKSGSKAEVVVGWHPRSSIDLTELIPALGESPLAEPLSSFSLSDFAITFTSSETELATGSTDPSVLGFFSDIYGASAGSGIDLPAGVGLHAALPTPEAIQPAMGALWMETGSPLVLQGSLPSGFLGGSSGGSGAGLAGLSLAVPLPEMRPPQAPEWFVAGQLSVELTGAPSLGLAGRVTVDMDGDILTFLLKAQLSRTSIQLIGGLEAEEPWQQPFGIEWLVMNELAFVLDADLATASVGIGFMGDVVIGEKDVAGAMFLSINVATGAPTNFVFMGESEAGVGFADLATLQSKMAAGPLGPPQLIPVDALPPLALTDLGVRFAPRAFPALDVPQGFAVEGQLWMGSNNLAGMEIDVGIHGIIANGHVDHLSLGELTLDDAAIDLALTLAEQHFGVQGRADLGFTRGRPAGRDVAGRDEVPDRGRGSRRIPRRARGRRWAARRHHRHRRDGKRLPGCRGRCADRAAAGSPRSGSGSGPAGPGRRRARAGGGTECLRCRTRRGS